MRATLRLSALTLLGLFFSMAPALAQSAGPDEAVQPNGTVRQNLALTAGQRSAIYNVVIREQSTLSTCRIRRPRTIRRPPSSNTPWCMAMW
jgi:Spy/CpxP family protein refolding chaperone